MNLTDLETKTNFDELDKKISIRHLKNGRDSRTYISGLHYFLNRDEQKQFIKGIQKKLGTGCAERTESEVNRTEKKGKQDKNDEPIIYGLQGEHVEFIKKYVRDVLKISNEFITE